MSSLALHRQETSGTRRSDPGAGAADLHIYWRLLAKSASYPASLLELPKPERGLDVSLAYGLLWLWFLSIAGATVPSY